MPVKRPKRELTAAQDFPVATGQATHPECICWFGWVCEDHHNQPWGMTVAAARAIRALGQTVHIVQCHSWQFVVGFWLLYFVLNPIFWAIIVMAVLTGLAYRADRNKK